MYVSLYKKTKDLSLLVELRANYLCGEVRMYQDERIYKKINMLWKAKSFWNLLNQEENKQLDCVYAALSVLVLEIKVTPFLGALPMDGTLFRLSFTSDSQNMTMIVLATDQFKFGSWLSNLWLERLQRIYSKEPVQVHFRPGPMNCQVHVFRELWGNKPFNHLLMQIRRKISW